MTSYHTPTPFVGTPDNPLTRSLPSQISTIDGRPTYQIVLNQPWDNISYSVTGGSGNYSYRQLRLPPESDPRDGFVVTDLQVLGSTENRMFGNGNTINERWWFLEVTDTDTGQVLSPVSGSLDGWFYIDITNYTPGEDEGETGGGGDGGNENTEYLLTGSVAISGTGSGSANRFIAGDTVTVTFTATNSKDGALTNVSIANHIPANTLVGAQNVALLNINDSTTWTMTIPVTASDVTSGSISVSAELSSAETMPAVTQLARTFVVGDTGTPLRPVEIWCEDRNYQPVPNDDVAPIIGGPIPWSGAHVQGYPLNHPTIGTDTSSPLWIKNVLDVARAAGHQLWVHLGAASDYGWNFSTIRGNYNNNNHINLYRRFSPTPLAKAGGGGNQTTDPVGHQAIMDALADGTLKGIQIIDEPFHERWSPGWNGVQGAGATGSKNYCTNVHLDNAAEECKAIFGASVKTAVRGPAINLGIARGGLYQFQHLTHAMMTMSPQRWASTATPGANKGFEWWYTIKNNFFGVSEWGAFAAQNLGMIVFMQMGTGISNVNPWTAAKNTQWENIWWNNNPRYPFPGTHKPYIKLSPWTADWEVKSMLSPRDPVTGILTDPANGGITVPESVIVFRYDRAPTDNAFRPFTDGAWNQQGFTDLINDLSAGDLTPRCGVPVGWEGDESQLNLPPTGTI